MPVDPEIVRRKATLILEDLQELRSRLEGKDEEAYTGDLTLRLVTERLLERMIGRMIDIGYHLAVAVRGTAPRDYHHAFLQLADLGVLPRDRARDLARAAGLRNRLAHEYNGLDHRRVFAGAQEALQAVPGFLRAVEQWIAEREEEE